MVVKLASGIFALLIERLIEDTFALLINGSAGKGYFCITIEKAIC